jgi:hypothetical protein
MYNLEEHIRMQSRVHGAERRLRDIIYGRQKIIIKNIILTRACDATWHRAPPYIYTMHGSLSHWLKYIKHIKRATIKNHFQWLNMRIYYCHAVDVCTHIEMYTCGYSLAGHNSRIMLQIFGLIRTSGRRLAHIRAASLLGAVRRRHWRRLRPPTPSCLENFPPHFLCVNEWDRHTARVEENSVVVA